MAELAAIAAQVKSVCDLLHQYEGLEKRQLRRIQTVDSTTPLPRAS
jgi:hypothetical protein